MFQYGEAVLVRPVVDNLAEEEDGDTLLACRLWFEEVLALETQISVFPPAPGKWR